MSEPEHVIPYERLPEGYVARIRQPPGDPAPPRPAATVALLRSGPGGPEVLLLRRARSAGFVPGAYVFPGGRVDRDDAAPALVERLEGLGRDEAARRLGLEDGDPPAVAYYVAALREAFEETGILVGRTDDGAPPTPAAEDEEVEALRERILEDEDLFPDVLDRMDARLEGRAVEYIAHWITPVPEPRRYDTRFFVAVVPEGSPSVVDPREMTDALWLAPVEALERHEAGGLPMIFPTIKTLESLRGFASPEEVLDAFAAREIPTILPRLVPTDHGVGLEADVPDAGG